MTTTTAPLDFDALDGLITPRVGVELYELARAVPAGHAIVEIGSYRGASTCCLAAGARDGNQPEVHAVDPWDPVLSATLMRRFAPATVAEFTAQLDRHGLCDLVTIHQARSVAAAAAYGGATIGLLYVDGDHSHDAVLADVTAWLPHLSADAVIAFDDFATPFNPGVASAVAELQDRGVLHPETTVRAGRLALCRRPS